METGYPGMPATMAGYGPAPPLSAGVTGLLPSQHPAHAQEAVGECAGSDPSAPLQPSPSPTGSAASSRSMSPAIVGQQGSAPPPLLPPMPQEPPQEGGYKPAGGGYPPPYAPQRSQYGHGGYAAPGQYGRPGHYPYQPQYTQHWPAAQHASGMSPAPPAGRPPPQSVPSSQYLRHHLQQKMLYAGSNGRAAAMPPPASLPSAPPPPHPPPAPPRPASRNSDGAQSGPADGGGAGALPTIGPDGAPLDDASQHSTLSSASATSEDRSRSPRPRPREPGSQPATPHSGLTSPGGVNDTENGGGGGLTSPGPVASPAWARSPVTVYNPVPARDVYPVSKKAESLNRLFEMDATPGRREWVSRLLAFMEERGTPIIQCPTVSKQPLDLFRLYHLTRDRGGFAEVTKNKGWKEIALALGIGGSSSGAYTLRKHYMKSLIFYEYQVERGGQDPTPVLIKYESKSSRKKREGSPGPQDSFSNSGSLDGFPGGYAGYPGGGDYGGGAQHQQSAPGGQVNVTNPFEDVHFEGEYGGVVAGFPASYPGYPPPAAPPQQPGYDPYPPPGGTGGHQAAAPAPPSSQHQPAGYPPQYSRSYAGPPTSAPPPPPPSAADYHRYTGPPPGPPTYGTRQMYGDGVSPVPAAAPASRVPAQTPPDNAAQHFSQYGAAPSGAAAVPPGPYKPAAPPGQTEVAPASAPVPQPAAQTQQNYGWRGYGQYGSSGQPGGEQRPSGAVPPPPGGYPPAPAQPQWNNSAAAAAPRAAIRRAQDKEQLLSAAKAAPVCFPPDSVEAVRPVLQRRRRGRRTDVSPLDGWRLTLALRCGQLAESRWALDVLQILSFDDRSVAWLSLAQMPGLLPALLQHFRHTLAAMFARRAAEPDKPGWYEPGVEEAATREPALGVCRPPDPTDSTAVLSGANYTHVTRRGCPVSRRDCSAEILVAPGAYGGDLCDDEEEAHLQTHIRVETGRVPFVRRLREGRAETETSVPAVKRERCDSGAENEGVVGGDGTSGLVNGQVIPGFDAPDFFLLRLRNGVPGNSAPSDATTHCDDSARKNSAKSKDECDTNTVKVAKLDVINANVIRNLSSSNDDGVCESKMDAQASPLVNGVATPPEQPDAEPSDPPAAPRLEIRDPAGVLKRKRPDEEDECCEYEEPSLYLTSATQENIAHRCVAISTILRNLSFVPGNEAELAAEPALGLLADLLLLHHRHPPRAAVHHNYDRDEDADFEEACSGLNSDCWWAEYLPVLHENALVTLTNVSGHVRLSGLPETLVRPVLTALLHWLQCPASYAADAVAGSGRSAPALPSTSLQRLSLEALCRLCVCPDNVDLLLATPPAWLLRRVCHVTAQWMCAGGDDQVRREMTLSLLYYLSAADERVARLLAEQADFVAALVRFVEAAEQAALGVASSQGVNALRDNPDLMGTSVDLLSRAAHTLLSMARLPEGRRPLLAREQQVLQLVLSQILDQRVAAVLAQVLYEISQPAVQVGS